MKYEHVEGPVICRYANTAPVINSPMAHEVGIEARVGVRLEQGRNVKLRILANDKTQRMTCHGKIDWIVEDGATGDFRLGLSHLSLSDEEFRVLLSSLHSTGYAGPRLSVRSRLRNEDDRSRPVLHRENGSDISRAVAVVLPLALIEQIDERREHLSFSGFVRTALDQYLKSME